MMMIPGTPASIVAGFGSTINFYRETLTPVGLVLHPRRTAKREKAAEEKDAFCGGGVNC